MPNDLRHDGILHVTPENAPKYKDWMATRGGLLRWWSKDFGTLDRSWTTPAKGPDGERPAKPHWSCAGEPELFTDPAKVLVEVEVVEVHRLKRQPKSLSKYNKPNYLNIWWEGWPGDIVIKALTKVMPLSEWQPSPQETVV